MPTPWYRPRRIALIVLPLVVIGAVVLRTSRLPAAAPARTTAPAAIPVAVATASRADMPLRLSALGSVTAFNTVTVRPRVDGQLMRVMFREGQFVSRGDLLAEIDPRPFQVQLEQAQGQLAKDQAQLASARVDLARYQTLLTQDSFARQNVDQQQSSVKQLEAGLQVDQAAIDTARLNLTYARIRSGAPECASRRHLPAGQRRCDRGTRRRTTGRPPQGRKGPRWIC
jgi:membrane fusion protein, multidrug efflux system